MTVGARLWLLRGGCSTAETIFLGDQLVEFDQLCQDCTMVQGLPTLKAIIVRSIINIARIGELES